MAARPTEIKLVAGLLEAPAESVEELAKAVINALDENRKGRQEFVLVTYDKPMVYAYGPYSTKLQATKAVEKGQLVASREGVRAGVFPLCKEYT
jgi:hypothetical protein